MLDADDVDARCRCRSSRRRRGRSSRARRPARRSRCARRSRRPGRRRRCRSPTSAACARRPAPPGWRCPRCGCPRSRGRSGLAAMHVAPALAPVVLARVPRAHEDVAVHDDVTLTRGVPARLGVVDLDRVLRVGDVDDPEAAPVALEGEVALEGDVGVDVGEAEPVPTAGSAPSSRSASCSRSWCRSRSPARLGSSASASVCGGRAGASSSTGAQSESPSSSSAVDPAHAASLVVRGQERRRSTATSAGARMRLCRSWQRVRPPPAHPPRSPSRRGPS